MLRRGLVKVLDFGLVKLTRSQTIPADGEASTRAMVVTDPGLVMGTAHYMSPEQAQRFVVDARTDIWSLGVVLYEMAAGRVPFEGATASHVIVSILEKDPLSLNRYAPAVPGELIRIINKALAKDREERYQVVKDLARDLKKLKEHLEFELKLGRSVAPDFTGGTTAASSNDQDTTQRAKNSGPSTVEVSAAHPTSSAEYLVSEIKRHKTGAGLVLAALVIAVAVTAYFCIARSTSKAAIDSIAVLPFANASYDPNTEYLSDGVTESIISSLSQLPQLRVMARSTVFRYKGREADPQQAGRELNVRAVLSGRVLQQGDDLVIRTELVNVADGTEIWGAEYSRKFST
jgi:serine/threonine-protein kinase